MLQFLLQCCSCSTNCNICEQASEAGLGTNVAMFALVAVFFGWHLYTTASTERVGSLLHLLQFAATFVNGLLERADESLLHLLKFAVTFVNRLLERADVAMLHLLHLLQ
jgi:hypothetical protein